MNEDVKPKRYFQNGIYWFGVLERGQALASISKCESGKDTAHWIVQFSNTGYHFDLSELTEITSKLSELVHGHLLRDEYGIRNQRT